MARSHNDECVIGVDVGAGSARTGLFDARGTLLASAAHPIQVFRPVTDHVEQSSREISATGIDRIHACGGGTQNPLWMQEHADITRCEIYLARDSQPVLLGAAILAAVAAGRHNSIVDAMAAMSPRAEVTSPRSTAAEFHARKYEVFKAMYEHQREYRRLRNGS
jgi:ribulose kinase